jgi:hypothetical protein
MKKDHFLQALEIISRNHSSQIYINKPYGETIGNLGATEFTIRIKDCCAKVMSNLLEAGYSLSMTDGLTSVNNYGFSKATNDVLAK